MVTQNHFVIPATFLEKFRSRGYPEGVTLTADHCNPVFISNNRMLAVTLIHHIIQNNPPGQRLDSVGPLLLSALTKLG